MSRVSMPWSSKVYVCFWISSREGFSFSFNSYFKLEMEFILFSGSVAIFKSLTRASFATTLSLAFSGKSDGLDKLLLRNMSPIPF